MEKLINKIHNCNNREILKQIPDKSIQVFLEDMPYGITACKWDTMPDLKKYWDLRLSKIKDNGCFVLFGCEPFSSYLRMSNIKIYKYDWILLKDRVTGHLNCKKMPMNNYEIASIFQYKLNYNPQIVKKNILYIRKHNPNVKKQSECYGKQVPAERSIPIEDTYPRRTIKMEKVYKTIHPTQKPVALFEYLIKTYSNENDIIFDGFSGSGTTAIACYNTNRSFICCELDKIYYDKSIERLKEVRNNLFDSI